MSPISKPMIPNTWIRRMSQAADHRYTSDGNSSSYSSAEDYHRQPRQFIPSFMVCDELGARSYVDPWDMENYSFLRKQLADISLSDNELSPAFESTQSDFYYVPLDKNGSPQYQYKRYVDVMPGKDGTSPQSLRSEAYGVMANIDEYDFYNEHLDSSLSLLQIDDSNTGFSNPSRQSERSRYNNQDYHTYTPPSIIKEVSDPYMPNQAYKLRRRASVSFRPDAYVCDFVRNGTLPPQHFIHKQITDKSFESEGKKSMDDIKIKLNRRKSFHDMSNNPELKFGRIERRKSLLDHPHVDKRPPFPTEISYDRQDKLEKSAIDATKRPLKNSEKGILQNPESRGTRVGLNVSFTNDTNHPRTNSRSHSPLVYVYETAKRKRKMFLPNPSSKLYQGDESRCGRPEIHDEFSFDPIEQYLNRPTSRFTMTTYGHLKIDYSCSWNYLDKCIAQRVCL